MPISPEDGLVCRECDDNREAEQFDIGELHAGCEFMVNALIKSRFRKSKREAK